MTLTKPLTPSEHYARLILTAWYKRDFTSCTLAESRPPAGFGASDARGAGAHRSDQGPGAPFGNVGAVRTTRGRREFKRGLAPDPSDCPLDERPALARRNLFHLEGPLVPGAQDVPDER